LNISFQKPERLKSRKAFENLLKKGSANFIFPYRIVWTVTKYEANSPAQIAFAVPKKRFKQAYKRNLIKRRSREAYRLNKPVLYEFLNKKKIQIHLLFVYIAPDILTFHEIEPKIKIALNSVMAALEKSN
jgi:ribonuclease P protein component